MSIWEPFVGVPARVPGALSAALSFSLLVLSWAKITYSQQTNHPQTPSITLTRPQTKQVANPTPGIWIVLYSRIRSWNGGALLGAMNRGAIGYV